MTVLVFAGCAGNNKSDDGENKSDGISVVTTIFPVYDWVKNIMGDVFDTSDVSFLLDSGIDMHSYQPTANDILKVTDCDVFIYVGGESDAWVADILKMMKNKNCVTLNLLDCLGDAAKQELQKEGMQVEEKEQEGEDAEYDEHIWLSLKTAKILCRHIADALVKADAKSAEKYRKNCETYCGALETLDSEYGTKISACKNKTLIFADRFPFRYLTDDYGLDYYAAFSGCSAESEAGFETIVFLAKKADEFSVGHIVVLEGGNNEIAKTVIESTVSKNAQTVTVDSMQSTTLKDAESGASYVDIMRKNLDAVITALS